MISSLVSGKLSWNGKDGSYEDSNLVTPSLEDWKFRVENYATDFCNSILK